MASLDLVGRMGPLLGSSVAAFFVRLLDFSVVVIRGACSSSQKTRDCGLDGQIFRVLRHFRKVLCRSAKFSGSGGPG